MEYCPLSVQMLIEKSKIGHLTIPFSHKYFIQLINGLDYIHSQSIIHRDIKPGNLLINSDGDLKITDFGIAEEFDRYSPNSLNLETFAGTHQFLSPEVAEGLPNIKGEKVDIWAAAVTLYNMISGRYPFEFTAENDLIDLYARISNATFEMPTGDDIDDDLKDLLKKMMEKDPEKRLSIREIKEQRWVRNYFPIPDGQELPFHILSNLMNIDEDEDDDDESNKDQTFSRRFMLSSLNNFNSTNKINSSVKFSNMVINNSNTTSNMNSNSNTNTSNNNSNLECNTPSEKKKSLFHFLSNRSLLKNGSKQTLKSKVSNNNSGVNELPNSIQEEGNNNENENKIEKSNNNINKKGNSDNNNNSNCIDNNIMSKEKMQSMLFSYDTTLIPYLKELFSTELEDELKEVGCIESLDLSSEGEINNSSNNNKHMSWFKKSARV